VVTSTCAGDPGEVQAAFDRLLMEQGEVTPVELLLDAGHLAYRDYEAWRDGRVAVLEEVLQGDSAEARQLLAQAAALATARGLVCEPHHYAPWHGGQPLRCSSDSDERLYLTRYRPPAERPQLDLFYDSREVALVNGVRLALAARQANEAGRLLHQLRRAFPAHPRLGAFERLVAALAGLDRPVRDTDREIAHLRDSVEPTARELLGGLARDFLVPQWRRLAAPLAARTFDPQHPERHASFAAARAEDWDAVLRAVEAELGWLQEPVLVQRHAAASERLGDQQTALSGWCRLCWDFPAAAAEHLPASLFLRRAWSDFRDLAMPLDTPDFPAWLALCRAVSFATLPDTANSEARLTLERVQWLAARAAATPDERLLAARRELQAAHPGLFEVYMAVVERRENSAR
jgi:hypothetical protein